MKFIILLFMLVSMSGCATYLTEAGRSIKLVQTDDREPIKNCERLETVRGETQTFLSGGEYGVFYATNDARNKAARIPSADTLVITQNDGRRFGGEVTGIAYNCSAPRNVPSRTTQPPERNPRELSGKPAETSSKKINDDVFEKASNCQKKGGVWVNDACIIKVE